VTAGVIGLYAAGVFERFELDMLDLRFRHFNKLGPSDLILHVDIGDDALERIHRWPWPRQLHARLIDTLNELGARAVVMDIVFSEDQQPRLPLPKTTAAKELAHTLARSSVQDIIRDDQELGAAVARAGNVYLDMFFNLVGADDPSERARSQTRHAIEQNPDWTTQQLIDHVQRDEATRVLGREELTALCRRVHLGWLLEQHFGSSVDDLVGRTGLHRGEVDKVLAGLKRRIAQKRVRQIMQHDPDASLKQLIGRILPTEPRDPLDAQDIRVGYETERAIRASLKRTAPIPPEQRWLYPTVGTVTPPLETLAGAARDVGFVTFETDSVDGVLREIPLVACYRGRMLRQLAFAVLCDQLDVPPDRVEMIAPDRLVLRGARWPGQSTRRDVVLPLDERGRLLLNWYAGAAGPAAGGAERWKTSFDHVAVGRVLEIPQNRAAARSQRKRVLAEAVQFTTARGAIATYERYVKLARARDQAERELAAMQPDDPNHTALAGAMDDAVKQMTKIEQNAVGVIRSNYEEIKSLRPENDDERREFAQIRQIYDDLSRVERLERRVADRVAELRPVVADKICFVGYTATAVADFVGTPVFERAPGVIAHTNLFHTLYTGALVRRSPRWLDVLLIVVCGLMVTSLITTWRGPIFSLVTTALALNVVAVAVAMWLFYQWRIWIIVPSVVAAVLGSWALITAYRQLTEGREKRLAFSRLGQYTSPTLARRIAEEPEVLQRAEAREVSCYFSDLKGFTSISEHLGAERTQTLLNVYLERMSEVLDRHEAFINKFLGDGIFAFFNPAVNPQPDHARLACEAALETMTALDDLIAEQRRIGGDEAFEQLRCRVGLATGNAVVGNCGSDRKFDYTCIGDTVNLAARLEPANKAFGTQIMVAESTRAAVQDLYEWRYLGGLQVVGKKQMVPVYEMLGRKGTVPDESLEYAEKFAQGIRLYQEQQWVDCITYFTRMLARRPDDMGLMLYIDRCGQFDRFGLPEDWSGAIELTEK